MKIVAVDSVIVKLPFEHGGAPTGFGGRSWGTIDILLVEVRSDGGMSGWGEAFGFNVSPATKAVLDLMVAPLLIGEDPDDIDGLCAKIDRALHLFGRNGPVAYAISGINIALWDLKGKWAGLPLWRLLGGQEKAKPIEAYASLLRYGTPEDVATNATRAVAGGYRAIKLHEVDLPCIEAARTAIGTDIKLMVDVNCAWSFETARNVAEAVRPLGLEWLEEPIWPPEDFASLARLRAQTGVSIAAGENVTWHTVFRAMLAERAVDIVQPSVIKCGGVSEFSAILAVAAEAGVRVAPHSPYFGPGFLATLHLIAASGRGMVFERLYVDLPHNLYGAAIHPVDGWLQAPDGPGLGLDPDQDVIARFRESASAAQEAA